MLKHPIAIALLATIVGVSIAAATVQPVAAKPITHGSLCDLVSYCLFESPSYCGMTLAETKDAMDYHVRNCH